MDRIGLRGGWIWRSSAISVSEVAAARKEDGGLISSASGNWGGWIRPNGQTRYHSGEQNSYSEERNR
ncbi:hypothetical protein E2562_002093 [Oryza meyeriana var. granulata]|uniref:Uncharacterized protein n=1 Tax=Oryza meyeriana var. granulata TaxID=110450 RepID=A0A6G1EFW6_9ORYZ|nr:hypothetical protein E2562_002093 [Oryza meyeriana var. granulata]